MTLHPGPASDVEVVLVTVPDLDTGKRLARQLVEERLIACANILPGATSIYTWKGEIEESVEVLLVLKTRAALFHRVEALITAEHPADTPEIISLPLSAASRRYAEWVLDSTVPT